MHNVSPSRAMERQARRYVFAGAFVLLLGLVLAALGVFFIVIPITRADWYSAFKALCLGSGVVTGLIGAALIIRGATWPSDNKYAQIMARILARSLDYRYTFIRNISRRGLGYIDAVLVGPNGALVFYFFDGKGAFYCEGNVWYRGSGRDLRLAGTNPTQQAVKDVKALRQYLTAHGLGRMPVYAVIGVVRPETRVTVRQPVVPVAHLSDVLAVVRDNYLAAERVDSRMVQETVRVILNG